MSASIASAFPSQNVLYDTASGATTANVQNRLLQNQEANQQIGATDMEMVGRAAGTLLNMNEPDAAAAYPGIIKNLQSQGFAKNAPVDYPGHAAVQAMVQSSIPIGQQYQYGILTAPGVTDAIKAASAPLTFGNTGGGGGLGGTYQPGTPFTPKNLPSGVSLDEDAMVRTVAGEAGSEPLAGQIGVANVIKNRSQGAGVSPRDVVFAPNQFEPWNGGEARAKLEAMDPTSPTYQAILNNVVRPVLAGKVADPTSGATHFFAPKLQSDLGRSVPAWGQGTPSAVIGNHNFYKVGYGPGQAQAVDPGAAPPVSPPASPASGTVNAPATTTPLPRGATVQIPPPTVPGTPPAPVVAPRPALPSPDAPIVAVTGDQFSGPGVPTNGVIRPSPPGSAADVAAIRSGMVGAGADPRTLAPGQGSAPAPDAAALPAIPTPNQAYAEGAVVKLPPNQLAPTQPPVAQNTAPAQQPPATGQNSPQFQAAMELNRRAQALDMVVDPTGRTKALAASLRAQAALYMQADSVSYDPVTGIGTKAVTGERVYPPAQRDTAVAQQDVMQLGPLVANGTATPAQRAQYAVAVETYRQPTLRENPVTKQTVRVNTRELPPGFPDPNAVPGGSAPPGGAQVVMPGVSSAQQQIEQDPAAYKVAESQYTRDAGEVGDLSEAGRQAQADQVRLHEMQDVLQRFNTGPGTGGEAAAEAWFQKWAPASMSGWEKQSDNLSGANAAQAFSKLALVGAGTQERSVLGARGGYQAIKLFKDANPNIDLSDATNKSILDMQMISNQANQDYTQAALSHFADNEKKFASTHQYDSLAQFDSGWNAQRNPQVYSAAMGAISGQPVSQWANGLSDPEYARALSIVSRANPSAVVNGRSGRISMQPGGQGTTTQTGGGNGPVSVRTPAEAQALPPGTTYTTPDGRTFTR